MNLKLPTDDMDFLRAMSGSMEEPELDAIMEDAILEGNTQMADIVALLQDVLPEAERFWKDGLMDATVSDFAAFGNELAPEVMEFAERRDLLGLLLMGAQAALLVSFLRGWQCAEKNQ